MNQYSLYQELFQALWYNMNQDRVFVLNDLTQVLKWDGQ